MLPRISTPDFATDDAERVRRQRMMAEANQAYADGNEAKLQAILREWESSPESVKGEGVGAELIRVIRKIAQIEERLHAIEDERRRRAWPQDEIVIFLENEILHLDFNDVDCIPRLGCLYKVLYPGNASAP